MINQANSHDFPSNRQTILKKLQRSGLIQLKANDSVRCAAGQVWITAEGGGETCLREGEWVRIPAKARGVWLTALSEAMVAVTGPGRFDPSHGYASGVTVEGVS